MKNSEIDVFIISFNRLRYLRELVRWLENAGFEKIHIVDNASTYPPLLEYLKNSKHNVHVLDKNYGHLAVWKSEKFKDIIDNKKYVVTDCDILPITECPFEIAEYFSKILDKNKKITKVGFSLKIDDLPESNNAKDEILAWEEKFWNKKIGAGLFDAPIDTTFALYRSGIYPSNKKWWKSIRTDFPYMAKHLPWYADSANPNEEDIFYQKNLNNESSFWSITDLELLKKHNQDLLNDLGEVYSSRKWRILQVIYRFLNLFVIGDRFSKKITKENNPPSKVEDDIKYLQKYNKQLVTKLGSIKNSGGWKFLIEVEEIMRKR